MNEEPMSRARSLVDAPRNEAIETALADLRRALEEDQAAEKNYHVRSAMQRLQLVLERTGGSGPP